MTINLIDTHTHLDFAHFEVARSDVIKQSHDLGVKKIVVVGAEAKNFSRINTLIKQYDGLYGAYGIHPWYLDGQINDLANYLTSNKCVACGEIGLDYVNSNFAKNQQQQTFIKQLNLAQSLQLPIILHVIKAHADVITILKRYKFTNGGIVHAFNGSLEIANEYLRLGFAFGIGGAFTYPQAHKLRKVLSKLPKNSLVLETDSPFMSPEFAPKIPNLPANLPKIAQIIANLLDIPLNELAQITTNNCYRFLRFTNKI